MKLKKTILCALCATTLGLGSLQANAQSVITDGSTSMEKVIGILIESFDGNGIDVTYNPTGSGAGIAAVHEGRADIGLSSRGLKDAEKASLESRDLAYDAIVIVVNKNNPLSDINTEQLQSIYTGKITNWEQVGAKSSPIVLIGREAGSGTRDGFESVTKTKDQCKYRQELTSTGDVITTVSQNENAIGYASLSAVNDSVKVLSFNGVHASEKTVLDKTYKLQRPFVLVTSKDRPLSESAQIFFDYALSKDVKPLIEKAGVVPAVK
ncbi:MAG: phosphate ABC transporter substrate-binding protein [Succinivibrio sp.]|uniref:phosphate ABC transporter substrate-binding protein n=1 Tax=Succinivibrio sp. TaxID=2053619 RepID=UPI002583A95C|nr:phosphate ABC transporter substrate-binding protein [Succinivibrio sp.]MCI6939315.1 phosphate ABC transporter substrate-binding protein [Succinatimonas hippei]MDD6206107.1 phosphate ABC transporter substrate-binding protein [Succinivibrio sp.]